MSDINVTQLYDSVLKHRAIKYKTYESVLKQCHKRIKRHAENFKLSCIYSVPRFIIGTPLYKYDELKTYLVNSLKKSGFEIKWVNDQVMYISWDLQNKKKPSVKKKPPPSQSRSIRDFNPSGRFVNDNSTAIKTISDKLNIIQL